MDIIFTVCNRFTLPNAMVLAESVKLYQPDSIFYLCLVDNIKIDTLPENVNFLDVEEIGIAGWEEMCKRYYDFELVAACRPWFAKFILNRESIDLQTLTFLAPTVLLLGGMDPIPLDCDLLLTPNIAAPLNKSSDLDDKRILNVGMFNSGSWTLRRGEATRSFLEWWAKRTFDRAKYDLCNGMCMDQLWLNYAPVLVPNTNFNNAGTWQYGLRSILNHNLTFSDQQYLVNGKKLLSVDFTGLACFDPVWSDHVNLISLNPTFRKLFREYEKRIAALKVPSNYDNSSPYGIVASVSRNRILRKKAVSALNSLMDFIDQV